MALTWLAEPTVDAVRAALRKVAPDLADGTIVPRGLEPSDDPQWCAASADVDGRFIVKFAWAQPAALRICFQAELLDALRVAAPGLSLPDVVTASRDPALLVTRRAAAVPFFDVRHRITPAEPAGGRGRSGRGPGRSAPSGGADGGVRGDGSSARADGAGLDGEAPGPIRGADPIRPAEPGVGLVRLGRPGARGARPDRSGARRLPRRQPPLGPRVVAAPPGHRLGDRGRRRTRVRPAMPARGLRYRPVRRDGGPVRAISGTALDLDRIMAWHLRTVLGDAWWRAEAGVPLPDHRTPGQWVDDLDARFAAPRKNVRGLGWEPCPTKSRQSSRPIPI